MSDTNLPALLISFYYLKKFQQNRPRYVFRDWVMDSGAFSAHASGKTIDLMAYIETCKELQAIDPSLTEIYALDVIEDWRASLKNVETMWKHGVQAIPCYHCGEPEAVLTGLARDYPKIALGGGKGLKLQPKNKWAAQCFARVWPKQIHGFSFGSESSLMTLPFHSVDATSWETCPCIFGRWRQFGVMSVRGSDQNLKGEVQWYLNLEQKTRLKWKRQMAQLGTVGPTVRLAIVSSGREEQFLVR